MTRGPATLGAWPRRSVQTHLAHYASMLLVAKAWNPVKVSCQSGSVLLLNLPDNRDIWGLELSVESFHASLALDQQHGLVGKVCHKTHRNRSLFQLYLAANIVSCVPDMTVTADCSHWTCVCERLLDAAEDDIGVLAVVLPHVWHVHVKNRHNAVLPVSRTDSSPIRPRARLLRQHLERERPRCTRAWRPPIRVHTRVWAIPLLSASPPHGILATKRQ